MVNSIDGYIDEVVAKLIQLWRKKLSIDERSKCILTDIYDFVYELWERKVITDSSLSLDILLFYYKFKRSRFEEASLIPDYPELDKEAASQKQILISQIDKLMQ